MSVFAVLWWVWGISASGNASVLLYCIPLIISAGIIIAASRHQPDVTMPAEGQMRVGRLVGIASGLEGLLIGTAFLVLANTGGMDFAAPVVAIIVGLHFIALARWFPARLYYATSALLIAVGIAGFWIRSADQRILYVCIGAACVLWLTCAVLLRHGNPQLPERGPKGRVEGSR